MQKLIATAAALGLLIVGIWWLNHERVVWRQKAQTLQAQHKAEVDAIAAQNSKDRSAEDAQRKANEKQISNLHAALNRSSASGADLARRLLNYANSTHTVPKGSGKPGTPDTTGKPTTPGQAAEDAFANYDAACIRDAARYEGLISQLASQGIH